MLRINTCVTVSERLLEHIQNRAKSKQNIRRGTPGRAFITLDEKLVLCEIQQILPWDQLRAFMIAHNITNNLSCVSAHWLHANSKHQQKCHRDHKHGYGRHFAVVFTIDGSKVDTMINIKGRYESASCDVLVYDTFELHYGNSGENRSKIFVGFTDPGFENYMSIAKDHLHGRKKSYLRIH